MASAQTDHHSQILVRIKAALENGTTTIEDLEETLVRREAPEARLKRVSGIEFVEEYDTRVRIERVPLHEVEAVIWGSWLVAIALSLGSAFAGSYMPSISLGQTPVPNFLVGVFFFCAAGAIYRQRIRSAKAKWRSEMVRRQ